MYAPYGPFFAIMPEMLPKNVSGEVHRSHQQLRRPRFLRRRLVCRTSFRPAPATSRASFLLMSVSVFISGVIILCLRGPSNDTLATLPERCRNNPAVFPDQEPTISEISLKSVLETTGFKFPPWQRMPPAHRVSFRITAEMLLTQPSGNLFGLSQNAGMGWDPAELLGAEVLILSTHGGLRAADGTPIALGFHTGHWEVGLLVAEAARELKSLHAVPFAGACTDPCDGRTQGTVGMLDSLPYRNDAAIVLRRLMRSLPTRAGVLGVATCDKGLPAMMMALASSGPLAQRSHPGRRYAAS